MKDNLSMCEKAVDFLKRYVEDWLQIQAKEERDKDIVNKYVNDKYCTFLFTLNGYETLFDALEFIQNPKNVEKIPI